MRAEYINPFLNSTMNLIRSMLGEEAVVGEKYLLTHFGNHRWEISGVIGLTGAVEGLIVIRLSRILAKKILDRTGVPVSRDPDELSQLINEMVGEMVNIIAGNGLTEIDDPDVDITVPFCVQGKNHSVAWPVNNPIIVIPFSTSAGPFEVTVSLKHKNSPFLKGL